MNRPLLLAVLLCALTTGAQQVRYRTADTVYLTVGSAAGVAVGDRFEIVRNNAVIATVEVIFVAENSASAKVIGETTAIAAGDATRRVGGAPAAGRPVPRPPGGIAGEPPADRPSGGRRYTPFALSGTASVDSESGESHDRSLGRLSLRARNILDLPLHARVRTRLSSQDNGNRIYDAHVAYEGSFLGVRAGRLGNSPYIGLGYLDGVLVRVSVTDNIQAGAFGGFQPDLRTLTFDSDATKYGGFVRLTADRADLVLAAATVGDNPFAAIDGRWSPNDRVSFFAHGRAGDESFNTMVGLLTQLSARQSVTVSYERVDPGPDDDLRTLDQTLDDFLRQGVRVTYRGPYAHVGAGIRSGDEGDDPTYSATAGIGHPDLMGRYTGISATGFSSALTDGVFAQARAGRRFGAGHTVELSIGALLVDENAIQDITTTGWARGAVWVELPYDLFARGEVEFTSGDRRTGHRLSLGAGYRF